MHAYFSDSEHLLCLAIASPKTLIGKVFPLLEHLRRGNTFWKAENVFWFWQLNRYPNVSWMVVHVELVWLGAVGLVKLKTWDRHDWGSKAHLLYHELQPPQASKRLKLWDKNTWGFLNNILIGKWQGDNVPPSCLWSETKHYLPVFPYWKLWTLPKCFSVTGPKDSVLLCTPLHTPCPVGHILNALLSFWILERCEKEA